MKIVHVDLWSDFVCPWCWIAKRRLEKAAQQLAGQVQVVVTNHSYRLAKGMAPLNFADALKMKFGSEHQAKQMMDAVKSNGVMEGLTYNFDTMRFGDTRDAHSLVQSLGNEADRNKMIEALSMASITDGRDIFDLHVLRDIALKAGFAPELIATFNFDQTDAIEADEKRASSIANGVPLFLFNDKAYLSGAQPTEVFVAALNQTAVESHDSLNVSEGAACGIDGCQI